MSPTWPGNVLGSNLPLLSLPVNYGGVCKQLVRILQFVYLRMQVLTLSMKCALRQAGLSTSDHFRNIAVQETNREQEQMNKLLGATVAQ